MFGVIEALLIDFVEILKVIIPMYVVFDITGDLLWK